jgi:hypothetical protein
MEEIGAYQRPDKSPGDKAPAGQRPSGLFWDPNVHAWRISKNDLVSKDDQFPIYYGKELTQYPVQTLSITIGTGTRDIPRAWIAAIQPFLDKHFLSWAYGVERGSKKKLLHLQLMATTHVARDAAAMKVIVKDIRVHLLMGISDGRDCVIVKVCEPGRVAYLLGYIQKVSLN